MKQVLLLAGDGIGPEIMAQAKKVLALLRAHGLALNVLEGNIGGAGVDSEGVPYPESTRALVAQADAVLLACVGGKKWDNLPRDLRPEQGLLAIRADLGVFANLRPVKAMSALSEQSSLKKELIEGLDLLIVRELIGDIYFGQPRGIEMQEGERIGFNTMRYSETEIRRIAKVAFEAARARNKSVCSIDKMNVLECSQLWREVVQAVSADYPDVRLTHMLVDNAAMQLIRQPKAFDVLLTGNLFGDILSDEASMLTGSIGLLPSASVREDGVGLYEPIHGSAPDIAGQNKANPLAMILSVGMMLRYSLEQPLLCEKIEQAVEAVINQGLRTADIAQKGQEIATTDEMGEAVCAQLQQLLAL